MKQFLRKMTSNRSSVRLLSEIFPGPDSDNERGVECGARVLCVAAGSLELSQSEIGERGGSLHPVMPTVHNILQTITPWRKQAKHSQGQVKKSPRKGQKVRAREKRISESWLEEDSGSHCDTLEILTPSLSNLQFKYNWNIKSFVDKVRTIRRSCLIGILTFNYVMFRSSQITLASTPSPSRSQPRAW